MSESTVFIISVKQVCTNFSHCHWLYRDSLKSDRSAALECRIPPLLMETIGLLAIQHSLTLSFHETGHFKL
jgi:hypothetical protein